MKTANKVLAILMAAMAGLSAGAHSVYADDEGVILGNTLSINQDDKDFTELFSIINNKPYIPLRLAFPNLNDKNNKIGLELSWDANYRAVRLIYGSTTGEDFIISENGKTMVPFEGVRKAFDMFLIDNTGDGYTGSLSYMEYTKNENGENVYSYEDNLELDDPVYLKKVADGGDRLFVSTDDINKISELLGVSDTYSVKLYTVTY